jgi:hypothetical protein
MFKFFRRNKIITINLEVETDGVDNEYILCPSKILHKNYILKKNKNNEYDIYLKLAFFRQS